MAISLAHGFANGLDAVLDAALVLKELGRNDIKIVLVSEGREKPNLQGRARGNFLIILYSLILFKKWLTSLMVGADLGLQI